jgi:hypothetical protein
MPNKIRRLGDNQNPIEEAAIKLVRTIYKDLIVQKKYCELSIYGKNKTIRDNNAVNSLTHLHNQVLNNLKSWNAVIEAKENGVDIHSIPIKTHKLDIVAGAEHKFGQYIIDKEDYEEKR